jgi:hypothetical protein
MDIKVVLDLDNLIKCIMAQELPKLTFLENVKLPDEIESFDAVLIINE